MTWYSKLGFYNNPFSIKPAAFHDELIAYDLGYIYEKIDDGEMLFLDGAYGTGKTTILKNIINRYGGNKRVAYYNFNRHDQFDVKRLIDGANTTMKKVLGISPKNLIVLLDEVVSLNKTDAKKLLQYFDDGVIKSIIFVNNDYYATKLPEEIEKRVSPNIIRTRELTGQEAVMLVRKRIGNIDLLTDSMIKSIFARSGNNPRKFLENCEDICRTAIEDDKMQVSAKHVSIVLGKEAEKQARKASKPKEKVDATKTPAEEKPKPKKAEEKPPIPPPPMPDHHEDKVREKIEAPKDEFDFIKDEVEVINLEDVEEEKKKKKKDSNEYQVAMYDIFDEE